MPPSPWRMWMSFPAGPMLCWLDSVTGPRWSPRKKRDLGPSAGKVILIIKSKANRQKQNNNQKRDTPDGNVVLVSRMHETECNRYNNQHRKLQTHTQVSADKVILATQRDGGGSINSPQIETSWEWCVGKQVCGVKLMSPGGREVAPSGDEKEDAGPGLLTVISC